MHWSPRSTDTPAEAPIPSRWNVPNVLCGIRLAGSPVLAYLAYAGLVDAFLWLCVVLWVTDWVDGKLAILLNQRTSFGTRLDTVADVVFYGVLVLSFWWLTPGLVRELAIGLAVAALSYLVSVTASWVKLRRMPSYHTRSAKTCWLLIGIAVISVLAVDATWTAWVVIIGVVIANLEAVAITMVSTRWQTNVPTIYHAVRRNGY